MRRAPGSKPCVSQISRFDNFKALNHFCIISFSLLKTAFAEVGFVGAGLPPAGKLNPTVPDSHSTRVTSSAIHSFPGSRPARTANPCARS